MPEKNETGYVRDGQAIRDRGLSSFSPLPNIVRIEELTYKARERYLRGIHQLNVISRNREHEKGLGQVFYGFKTNASDSISYTVTPKWGNDNIANNVLGVVSQGAKAIAGAVTENLPAGKQRVASTVGNAANLGTGIIKTVAGVAGIDYNATGAATMQGFEGVNFSDLTVKCGWYMPEQYDVAMKSMRTIHRMAYPRSANDPLSSVVTDITDGIKTKVGLGEGDLTNAALNWFNDVAGVSDTMVNKALEIGGFNLTYDPLPVRLSMGQFMDIEPLVIDEINVDFSSEMFVKDGKTYPMFCNVDIKLKFWVTPDPSMEFFKILDTEMFGKKDLLISDTERDIRKANQ